MTNQPKHTEDWDNDDITFDIFNGCIFKDNNCKDILSRALTADGGGGGNLDHNKKLLEGICYVAVRESRLDILQQIFFSSSSMISTDKGNSSHHEESFKQKKRQQTILKHLREDCELCSYAAIHGQLESLKFLRQHGGCKWDQWTWYHAHEGGHDEMVEYLRENGCPEWKDDDREEMGGSARNGNDVLHWLRDTCCRE